MTRPRNSHIQWWCLQPSSPFCCFTPLLRKTAPKGLSDLHVSSYTTTLAALIRAKRPGLSDSGHEKPRFIAVGQAVPSGSKLLCVNAELDTIGQFVDGPATFTRIEGDDACISIIAKELRKNGLVHFACHGVLTYQVQPFKSAFALRDGEFTIQRISQRGLKNPKFAYLSARHTIVGDQESPNGMIHLASSSVMQFAGFRSVIGTMWAVDDSQTDKVISMFYK